MPRTPSLADVEIDVDVRSKRAPERPEADTPFRILLLADLSGRANRGCFEPALKGRRPILIDRDNFEDVLSRVHPELHLPVTGSGEAHVELRFRELDDFHPDRIFEGTELFRALRETRDKLSDRATFAEAAASLRSAEPAPPPPAPSAPPRNVSLSELLDQEEPVRPERALDDWNRLIRDIVAPHLVPTADPRQSEMIAQVDEAIASLMRAVLHQPDLQQLEAAWRGLFFLVQRIETGADLKLYVLDVSQAEMAACLEATREDLRASALYELLVEETVNTPGAEPWAVVCCDYYFDQSEPSLQMLARLGAIARQAGAPLLGGASPRLLEKLADGPWSLVRRLPQAPWIGLAMPRFLLRLPYGKETTPIEQFVFEEMPRQEHDAYLWCNASFACVCLLGQAFGAGAWEMQPGGIRDIDDLPLHLYRENGETRIKPCAEVLMTEQQAEALLDNGIMALVSLKDRDRARLLRLQSIADPPTALAGPWE